MIDPCCGMMSFYGRDHYSGVPEAELPDAIIEHFREEGRWRMDYRGEGFLMEIYHCPWCGVALAGD
jgi:hypothetical protein